MTGRNSTSSGFHGIVVISIIQALLEIIQEGGDMDSMGMFIVPSAPSNEICPASVVRLSCAI
jgi:hypothetical protein